MIKEDVLQYLKDNGYLLHVNGETIITNKFIRDIGARAINTKNGNSKLSSRTTNPSVVATKEEYKQFIVDAEIPTIITTGNGKFFANRFSEKGYNTYKSIVDRVDAKVLLAACKWYYKQTSMARVMIGNWFSEGIWESCYDDMQKAVNRKQSIPIVVDDNSSNMEQG